MDLDMRGRWRITADAERIREAFSALRSPRGVAKAKLGSDPVEASAQLLRR
jgi:hypothetical protein